MIRVTSAVRHPERGSIAPAIPIIALVLLVLGGLIIDASRQLDERGEAVAYAEEAARSGAQGIDLGQDHLALDPQIVRRRVADYCRKVSADPAVTSCGLVGIEPAHDHGSERLVVHAHVTMRIPATLLGIVGITSLSASGDGRARPVEGLSGPDR